LTADDPDVGEGEGDDLGGVGRIGQDFLVAGHCCVEADLADRRAGRADPKPSITAPFASTITPVAMRGSHPEDGSSVAGARSVRVALDMRLCLSAALAARQAWRRLNHLRSFMPDSAPLRDTVATRMKEAMKGGEKVRVGALRLIMAR